MRTFISVILATCLTWPVAAQVSVEYQPGFDWGTGFDAQMKLQNRSIQTFEDWTLEFDFPHTLETIWEAQISSHEGDHYVIKPVIWNRSISAGGSVSFGFVGRPNAQAATPVSEGPTNIVLQRADGTPVEPPDPDSGEGLPPLPGGITLTLEETGRWLGGYSASLTVENLNESPIEAWDMVFRFRGSIDEVWNADWFRGDGVYRLSGAGATAYVESGQSVTVGFTGTGNLADDSISDCTFNGAACDLAVVLRPPTLTFLSQISIDGVDDAVLLPVEGAGPVTQFTVEKGTHAYPLRIEGRRLGQYEVSSNNPRVATAEIGPEGTLVVTAHAAGRAALRIRETDVEATRLVGVRVKNDDGTMPGLPDYLALGSVSEDTSEHIGFWQDFGEGETNRYVDIRYIYLNGGPFQGWNTWGSGNGGRAVSYIRESRKLGMVPFFVFYNIPDSAESYQLDLAHVQDPDYMEAYFENLKFALEIVNQESPDDVVGFILEPDFLGYLAQNAGAPASAIPAATQAVYQAGVLDSGDPQFENTVAGLVKAINYVIASTSPQVIFGWQMNLWASPAGGWTVPPSSNGLMHRTAISGITNGRAEIYNEARAITQYYVDAGVNSWGASFLSIDKYGLDAVGFQSSAATDPASSYWFWNNDIWGNYLVFARAVHETADQPVVLWQIPVGHINRTTASNPYSESGQFQDLSNLFRYYEDSAGTYFFGDTFVTTGNRYDYFSQNSGADPGLITTPNAITWARHFENAADAGIITIMFGPGVGASTTNLGAPPTDDYWWITKASEYLADPVPLGASEP